MSPCQHVGMPQATPTPQSLQGPEFRFGALVTVLAVVGGAMCVIGIALDVYLGLTGARQSLPILGALVDAFHPNGESNLFAWYSAFLLALLAVVFGIAMLVNWRTRERLPFAVMAGAAIVLSAGEGAALQDRLRNLPATLGIDVSFAYLWLVIAAPVAVAVGVWLTWVARSLDRVLRRRLILGGALYLAGAIGIEALGGLLTTADVGHNRDGLLIIGDIAVLVEESLEVAGVLVALWAALDRLGARSGPGGSLVLWYR